MSADTRKNVICRLRRIEGQVRGVQRMIAEEADCGEILNQIAAIKSAVNQAGIVIFKNHARRCIVKSMDNDDQDQSFDEIIRVMSRFIK
ncbi:MAG: metal-sensitive transcriptional regulator [Syntrophomonas sp.]|nr:metal-sensitive transcriptional regulator [Syntrophomonas sp.]